MVFGRKKKRQKLLAERLAGDQPSDRLLAALHGGAVVVVDGDAAANLGWPHLPISTQREALVHNSSRLVSDVSTDSTAVHLLFDLSVEDVVPRSNDVTIEMVADRITAAERAHDVVEAVTSAGGEVVAVWNDDANGISLRAAGATLVDPHVLLDAFLDTW